jgi:hypothetical protein
MGPLLDFFLKNKFGQEGNDFAVNNDGHMTKFIEDKVFMLRLTRYRRSICPGPRPLYGLEQPGGVRQLDQEALWGWYDRQLTRISGIFTKL